MGTISWFKGKRKIPPGTTETKIKYGRASDSVLWPKKGKLYTRSGELHVPVVVRTKDKKLRVGDCVIRYQVANPTALLPYLDGNGKLEKGKLERDLAYEARGTVSPNLGDYNSEELLKGNFKTKAFMQNKLSKTLNCRGLSMRSVFMVWDDPELPNEIWNKGVENFYKGAERVLLERERRGTKIRIKKRGREKKKTGKKKQPRRPDYNIHVEVKNEKPQQEMSKRELRLFARKQARTYVRNNPRYSSAGEAAFWTNTFEQIFYKALEEGGHHA